MIIKQWKDIYRVVFALVIDTERLKKLKCKPLSVENGETALMKYDWIYNLYQCGGNII